MVSKVKRKQQIDKNIKNIICKMVVVAVLMLLTTIIYQVDCQLDAERQMNIVKEKEKSLQVKLDECEKNLLESTKNYVKDIGAKPCVLLCFDDFEKSAYGAIIDTMDRYGFKGIIVFRDGKVPGTQDGITVELYQKLLDKGWEGAIGNSESINVYNHFPDVKKQEWIEYIVLMQDAFCKKGLQVPDVYIPHEDEAISEIVDLLASHGLASYTRLEEDFMSATTKMDVEEMNEMGMIVGKYGYESLSRDISNLIPVAESVAILFERVESGAPKNKEHTSYLELDAQLERLSMLGEYVNVTTFSGYREYQQQIIKYNEAAYKKYSDEQRVLKEQIEALKAEITENYAKISEK